MKIQIYRTSLGIRSGEALPGDTYLKEYPFLFGTANIIEDIGKHYGGGNFRVTAVDDEKKEIYSSNFQIAGLSKDT